MSPSKLCHFLVSVLCIILTEMTNHVIIIFFTIACVKITLEIIDIGISDAHHFQYFATCLSYALMET